MTTIDTLKAIIEYADSDMPVVIFDDNEGEYVSVRAYIDTISRDTSWARYTTQALIIEATNE